MNIYTRAVRKAARAALALAALLSAAHAKADVPEGALVVYVSQKAGQDGNNGATWKSPVKTIGAAMALVDAVKNTVGNYIYVAEGEYNVTDMQYEWENQRITIQGGFPTPGRDTEPEDTCSASPKKYVTKISPNQGITNSWIRMRKGSNQLLALRGLTLSSNNFLGSEFDGSIVTMDYGGADQTQFTNPTFEMSNCIVEWYRSKGAGAIYVYGTQDADIYLKNVEVLQGVKFGTAGGGFLGCSMAPIPTGLRADISHVTFRNLDHGGAAVSNNALGLCSGQRDGGRTPKCDIDRLQVNYNTGGLASGQMASVLLDGMCEVTLTNSHINNSTGGEGGGLWISGFKTFTCSDTQFYNCFGGQLGGAVVITESVNTTTGAVYKPTGNGYATFTRCEFARNHAARVNTVGDGGAVWVQNEALPDFKLNLTFNNCDFKDNYTANLEGGAVYVNTKGSLNFTDCTFCGNKTNGSSGAGSGGAVIVKNAEYLTVEGCYFNGNSSQKSGGAMCIENITNPYSISNTQFVNNDLFEGSFSIAGQGGGAVLLIGDNSGSFTNCLFQENNIVNGGGAVSFKANTNEKATTFTKCRFYKNTAGNGGAICSYNSAARIEIYDCEFIENGANNTSCDGGGAIAMMTGARELIVKNSLFQDNYSYKHGGALMLSGAATQLDSKNNRYYGNRAAVSTVDGNGGAIFYNNQANNDHYYVLEGDVFYGNETGHLTATDHSGTTIRKDGWGGAIFFEVSQKPTGKRTVNGVETSGDNWIKNAKFVGNKAISSSHVDAGGAIYLKQNGGDLLLYNDARGAILDELSGTTFYNNAVYSGNAYKTDVKGADIAFYNGYSDVISSNNAYQNANSTTYYPSNVFHDTGSSFSNTTDPLGGDYTPAPDASEQQWGNTAASFTKTTCADITERDDAGMTTPSPRIFVSETEPVNFAQYCPGEDYWVEFTSDGGHGRFQFEYDVYKSVGNTYYKMNTEKLTAQTPDEKVENKYTTTVYDYTKPIKATQADVTAGTAAAVGDTIGYEVLETKEVVDYAYVRNIRVQNPLAQLGITPQRGELYTFVLTSVTDGFGTVYSKDCYSFDASRTFSQSLGAQILFNCADNYWVGSVSQDFNDEDNWTRYVPQNGENIVFANSENNPIDPDKPKSGPAQRDCVLPATMDNGSGTQVPFSYEGPTYENVNTPATKKDAAGNTVAGHPALVIPQGAYVAFSEVVTTRDADGNPANQDGDKDKILVKAPAEGEIPATFYVYDNHACDQDIYATFEFKPLGLYNPSAPKVKDTDPHSPEKDRFLDAAYDWQYIGVPVASVAKYPAFNGSMLRRYDEPTNSADFFYRKWVDMGKEATLAAFQGWEVVAGSAGLTHTFGGKLNLCDADLTLTRSAAVVTASLPTYTSADKAAAGSGFSAEQMAAVGATKAKYEDALGRHDLGQNIFGNSFAAAIDIRQMEFGSGVDPVVYIYNHGSWGEWQGQSDSSSKAKGGFTAVPKSRAGQDNLPVSISTMQGFLVKFDELNTFVGEPAKVTLPYGQGKALRNTEPLRTKAHTGKDDGLVTVEIDNGKVYDRLYIYRQQGAGDGWDRGGDVMKLNMGEPAVWANTYGTDLQFAAVGEIDGQAFGVETEQGGLYTLRLSQRGLPYGNLKLVDTEERTVVDFPEEGLEYGFAARIGGRQAARFILVDTPETSYEAVMGVVTGMGRAVAARAAGTAEVYTAAGAKVGDFRLPVDASKLPSGIYMVKTVEAGVAKTAKVVVE